MAGDMPTAAAIRVLIADDHPLIRSGLKDMLSLTPHIQVVAEAGDGPEAVALYREHRPDVAILDLRMPTMDGTAAMKAIRAEFPEARLIALSSHRGDEDIHRAMAAGAGAYVFKTVLAAELAATIDAVAAGHKRLSPEAAALLKERMGAPSPTARELEVLELMVKGADTELISSTLGITVETVKVHVKRIISKLGVSSRAQAVATAIERGIVHID
jgi:two-component system NarL family response regulator